MIEQLVRRKDLLLVDRNASVDPLQPLRDEFLLRGAEPVGQFTGQSEWIAGHLELHERASIELGKSWLEVQK